MRVIATARSKSSFLSGLVRPGAVNAVSGAAKITPSVTKISSAKPISEATVEKKRHAPRSSSSCCKPLKIGMNVTESAPPATR